MTIPSRGTRLVSLWLAGLGVAALACGQQPAPAADEPVVPPPSAEEVEFEELLGRLTAPLRPELVRAAIRHPWVADSNAALGLVAHLTALRGVVAAQGTLELVNHQDPEVRIAALRGVATLGLRVAGAADSARGHLNDFTPAVRFAAIATLGVIGEADDIAQLLELLAAEDKESQGAAFRALRKLTGGRNANDARIWTYWWKQTERELPKRLEQALHLLADGGSDADYAEARRLLAGSAWFYLPKLEDAAREWLASTEPRHRCEGFHLVTAAQLGSLAEEVAKALNDETEPECLAAGLECATALGIRAAQIAEVVPAQTPR